ncbi:endothelial differentiation-related factor 1 isoform X1 [Aedes albopictus]|uniref:Multiprotein bridging factor 1 N-terminal domain-containing protein n=1 Tax=Aedes albopictus TaxID=7160 RepID=A0ABM1YS60_AEDAL
MSESDWDTVTVLRKKAPKASSLKTESAVNQARRQGLAVETSQKFNAGTNKQHTAPKNTAKLDREHEELKHKQVSHSVSKLIMQGRQAKGLSQKDLATKICETFCIVLRSDALSNWKRIQHLESINTYISNICCAELIPVASSWVVSSRKH